MNPWALQSHGPSQSVVSLVVHRFFFSQETVGTVQLLTLLSLLLSQRVFGSFILPEAQNTKSIRSSSKPGEWAFRRCLPERNASKLAGWLFIALLPSLLVENLSCSKCLGLHCTALHCTAMLKRVERVGDKNISLYSVRSFSSLTAD